jgi:hypothetical protein
MIEVYHLNDEAFFDETNVVIDSSAIDKRYYDINIGFKPEQQLKAAIELFNEGYYYLVAKVDTNSLDHAWQQTNHIDDSWLKNNDVEEFILEARSSKVGDIMKDDDGKFHIVASVGFSQIADGAIKGQEPKSKVKP